MSHYAKGWTPEMSLEETKNLAYWERNMLALMLAKMHNQISKKYGFGYESGWYYHGEFKGWSRVISIDDGYITFHIPDDFDTGDLPEIKPNWDGHSTEEKWNRVAAEYGVKL